MTNRIEELEKQIEILDEKVDILIREFDKEWFKTSNNKSFEEYSTKRVAYCQPYLNELIKMKIKFRMNKPYVLEPLPNYGDVMSLKEFIECVKGGGFIDYDGYGHYVKDNQMTDIEIYPSDVKSKNIRNEFDTIIWFNR